jgi:ubiquinol-cytochrome c reductase cytochrome b subunit
MQRSIRWSLAVYKWLDDRLAIGMIIKITMLHPVPKSVNWWYAFGFTALTAFVFQIVTGVFLAFAYVPTPDHAYASLSFITHQETFGNIIRGIHYWGASAMVLIVFVHMTSHFLTGSYKFPRELQWLSGSLLLLSTILMAFTGQLLRWNQDAYWAIVVGAEQTARFPFIGGWLAQLLTAGPVVGGNTLTRFYAIHVFLVPGLMFLLIGMHLYLVIYKGISEWPVPGRPVDPKTYWPEYQRILHEDGEPFFPRAIFKDAVISMLGGIIVVGLALWLGAAPDGFHAAKTLGAPADPTIPANPRPDWYLIWYFALLALIPPASENFVIILFPLLAFVVLFLIPLANKGERHFAKRPWALAVVIAAAFSTGVLVYLGYVAPWSPDFVGQNSDQIPALSTSTYHGLSPPAQAGAKLMHDEGCLACHRIGSVGGLRGPDLSKVGDRLTYDQFVTRIMSGGGGMPAYGNTISTKDANAIIAFLETRSSHPQQAAAPGAGGAPPIHAKSSKHR